MKKFLGIFFFLLILGFSGYYAFVYYVTYSEGIRSGELIKFSKKGMFIKTWEGELSQGISGANMFIFSVESKQKEVIYDLKEYQGKYIKVHYKERYKTFPWLGETTYFITKVELEKSPHSFYGSSDNQSTNTQKE